MTIFCIISQNGMILHAKMSTILTFKIVEENDWIFRGNDWIFRIWLNFSDMTEFFVEMTEFFVWNDWFFRLRRNFQTKNSVIRRKIQAPMAEVLQLLAQRVGACRYFAFLFFVWICCSLCDIIFLFLHIIAFFPRPHSRPLILKLA